MNNIERLVEQLIDYTQQINNIDPLYYDTITHSVFNTIVNVILTQYPPQYKINNPNEAKAYVCSIIPVTIYDQIDISDSHWKYLLNTQYKLYNKFPHKMWKKLAAEVKNEYSPNI